MPASEYAAVGTFAELVRAAWENRRDIVALQQRVGAAEENVDVAQAGRWPSVSLSASYGSAYTTASDFAFDEQLDQRRGGSIGVGVSVPLFDRGNAGRATEQAMLAEQNARLALDDLRQAVAIEVRRAVLDYNAAGERLAAAEARVVAANRALTATQQRYDAGVATLLEVTQARAEMTAATSALVNARYTLLFQQEALDYYAGELTPEADIGD
jgi:outer membrane protein